jgi:hypothetical protein
MVITNDIRAFKNVLQLMNSMDKSSPCKADNHSSAHGIPALYNSIRFVIDRFCGQSSWLQIQRSRVRFQALPDFLISSGLEQGSVGLARITEELPE